MKFIHTSDLHIGLKICEQAMNDVISGILDEIVQLAVDNSCTAVVIAGDIYDRSNPTPDSVKIFDEFVSSLVKNGIAVVGISGNHDSPERVGCFSDVLKNAGVYFSPAFDGKITTAKFSDEYGDVNFILLPFAKPSLCANYADVDITNYTEAIRYQLSLADIDQSQRNIIVAHGFTGSAVSDDEAGGTGHISHEVFEIADYTALGHLHTAHSVGGENIRYSGSPVRCSFAEVEPEKSVNLVTMGEKGNVTVEKLALHPTVDLREIHGTYDELTSLEMRQSVGENNYIKAVLTDEDDITDAVMKLRIVYPRLLQLAYDNHRTRANLSEIDEYTEKLSDTLKLDEVFSELYELQNGQRPDDDVTETVRMLLREVEE